MHAHNYSLRIERIIEQVASKPQGLQGMRVNRIRITAGGNFYNFRKLFAIEGRRGWVCYSVTKLNM